MVGSLSVVGWQLGAVTPCWEKQIAKESNPQGLFITVSVKFYFSIHLQHFKYVAR